MAVKPLRRLGAPVDDTLFDRMSSQLLHSVDWKTRMDAFQREHPELIVRRGDNVMAALPRGAARLVYGFENERAFTELFPAMFDELLPRIRRVLGAEAVMFRLEYPPARPRVEPVLKNLWFRPQRDWLGMTLQRPPRLPAPPSPRGVRFRPGGPSDFDDVHRIDRQSFPDTPLPAGELRARLRRKDEALLIAMVGTETVGFCISSMPDPGFGFINVLAVATGFRRRAIGEALTIRASRELFRAGAREIGLTTDAGNPGAIALYVKLGFKQTRAGRDYDRPVDARAVEKLRTASRGTLIRFGGWR
jgi:ribosomal protein S18 acetylase RimI-like enzyme